MQTTSGRRLSEAMRRTLESDRAVLNARYAERKLAGLPLDGPAVLDHLAEVVDPIVAAVAHRFPERAPRAVHELFDVSLDLFSRSLLGPNAWIPEVDLLWRRVLPIAGELVGRDPRRVAGSLSNAVYHLAVHPAGQPTLWMDRMTAICEQCHEVDPFLKCGQVLAWLAGLPQYRRAALEIAAHRLHSALARRVLSLPDELPDRDWQLALSRLRDNPWLSCEAAVQGADTDRVSIVRTVGAFRGFAGLFLRPPLVRFADGTFWVSDGETLWQLNADRYGWDLHRCGDLAMPKDEPYAGLQISPAGEVLWNGIKRSFPELATPACVASDGVTTAVTVSTSHQVYLLARL